VQYSEKIWLVVFHTGFLELQLNREAILLRGVVRFAMVNRFLETELVESLDVDDQIVAMVFNTNPHDPTIERKQRKFSRIKEALQYAKSCVDDSFEEFQINLWEGLIESSYVSIPSRFPGVLLLEEEQYSFSNLALRAAASQMKSYFHFFRLSNATKSTIDEKLQQFTMEKDITSPGLFVIIAENWNTTDQDGKLKFYALRYDPKTHGSVQYPKVMSFLLGINAEFRHTLPGNNFAEDLDVVQAKDVIISESDLFHVADKSSNKSDKPLQREPQSNDEIINDEL
jgi:hypothetical protein